VALPAAEEQRGKRIITAQAVSPSGDPHLVDATRIVSFGQEGDVEYGRKNFLELPSVYFGPYSGQPKRTGCAPAFLPSRI
jgi:hypothetical protein